MKGVLPKCLFGPIWWGEATDEPHFSEQNNGALAPPNWIWATRPRDAPEHYRPIRPIIPYSTGGLIYSNLSLVSKMIKAASDLKPDDLSFEEALKKLEAIVEAMEAGDLPLETLLSKYEEGSKLVRICQEKLAEAELKIQQLEKNAAGEMKLKAVDLSE